MVIVSWELSLSSSYLVEECKLWEIGFICNLCFFCFLWGLFGFFFLLFRLICCTHSLSYVLTNILKNIRRSPDGYLDRLEDWTEFLEQWFLLSGHIQWICLCLVTWLFLESSECLLHTDLYSRNLAGLWECLVHFEIHLYFTSTYTLIFGLGVIGLSSFYYNLPLAKNKHVVVCDVLNNNLKFLSLIPFFNKIKIVSLV